MRNYYRKPLSFSNFLANSKNETTTARRAYRGAPIQPVLYGARTVKVNKNKRERKKRENEIGKRNEQKKKKQKTKKDRALRSLSRIFNGPCAAKSQLVRTDTTSAYSDHVRLWASSCFSHSALFSRRPSAIGRRPSGLGRGRRKGAINDDFSTIAGPPCCSANGNFLAPRDLHPACLPIFVPSDDPFYLRFRRMCLEMKRAKTADEVGCDVTPVQQVSLRSARSTRRNYHAKTLR